MPDSVCGMALTTTWRVRLTLIANANCEVVYMCRLHANEQCTYRGYD